MVEVEQLPDWRVPSNQPSANVETYIDKQTWHQKGKKPVAPKMTQIGRLALHAQLHPVGGNHKKEGDADKTKTADGILQWVLKPVLHMHHHDNDATDSFQYGRVIFRKEVFRIIPTKASVPPQTTLVNTKRAVNR